MGYTVLRAYSYLRLSRRELLREFFSARNRKKRVHNLLLNVSVHAKLNQISSVNVPNTLQCIILQIVHTIGHV